MERLWAPWRVAYIRAKAHKGCIFCVGRKNERQNRVIFKTKNAIAMLNIFPYNNGHIMVAPTRHIRRLDQLTDEELLDLFRAVEKAQGLLQRTLKPHGFNIGINVSKSAGAGIAGHLHIHIVPRWRGDTNFMPSVFNTKVISQSLDELYGILRNALSK